MIDQIIRQVMERADGPPITVVRPGALGDTVVTVPTLQMLWIGREFAQVTLVGSEWAERLRPLVPTPLNVARFDSTALTPMFGPDPQDPQGLFTGAEKVVIYGADEDDIFVHNVRRLCPGEVTWWPAEPPPGVHAAAHLMEGALGERPDPPPLARLVPPVEALQGPGPGAFLAVHPGSGGPRKCWPAESFAQVVRELAEPVLLVEGPADAGPCAAFRRAVGDAVPVYGARGLSLPELSWALALCRAYLGNDSGVSHLAGALGVPTVAAFGPTDPATWGPMGRPCLCVGGQGHWPQPDEVLRAVRDVVAAREEG